MNSLDALDGLLTDTVKLLNQTASQIINLGFNSDHNLRKIADALVNISDIRAQLNRQDPDLPQKSEKE